MASMVTDRSLESCASSVLAIVEAAAFASAAVAKSTLALTLAHTSGKLQACGHERIKRSSSSPYKALAPTQL